MSISHSYFVVMEDFGRNGREACVNPETTRRAVVDNIKTGQYGTIAFIHHIHDGTQEDVTNELLAEAGFFETADAPLTGQDLIEWRNDHARDLRKVEREIA